MMSVNSLQVLNHELHEHELKDVLAEAMENMITNEAELEADEEEGGTNCFGKRQGTKSTYLSPEELESATKWLLERFGHEGGGVENDLDDGEDEVCFLDLLSHQNFPCFVASSRGCLLQSLDWL
jgi:hypothetical protein